MRAMEDRPPCGGAGARRSQAANPSKIKTKFDNKTKFTLPSLRFAAVQHR